VEGAGETDGRTEVDLLDSVWEVDLTQQRVTSVGLAGMSGGRPGTSDVAYIQANVFVLGAR
jgi:hypothetical protein